jgi:hypothetical protein
VNHRLNPGPNLVGSRLASGRLPGESSRAYHAYRVFRDLSSRRSLRAAWQAYRGDPNQRQRSKSRGRPRIDNGHTACSGQWTKWSHQFRWRERAAAYHAALDSQECTVREAGEREQQEQRFAIELRNQENNERRVKDLDALLKSFTEGVLTEVTVRITVTVDGRRITHTSSNGPAINLTRYAKSIQVRNQAARAAILGDSRRPTHPMETLEARRRLLQPPSALGRKRLPGESYEAYRAFCIYRDQGPGRSLNKAWRQERAERGKGCPQARCPGRWRLWAREWKWVERAVSYDAVQNRAGLEHHCALEERRFEFEWENQVLLEELVSQIDSVLEKAPDAAGTDMTQKTKEKINGKFIRTTTTIVKCLNLFGYAALVKACRDSARLAILGVRPHDLFDFPAALLVRLN